MDFKSERQRRLYDQVVSRFADLGYRNGLLIEGYAFQDLFAATNAQRSVPAAVFGRTPPSYDTACFAVVLAGEQSRLELVTRYRAFGAPVVLEVDEATVRQWKVAADDASTKLWSEFPVASVDKEFQRHAEDWSPDAVLRAKNIALHLGARQLDFIDIGLMPALERHVRDKLDGLLRRILTLASRTYRQHVGRDPNIQELFRLVFRFLAAKVLCDRHVAGFRSISGSSDPVFVLNKVSQYYRQAQPVLDDLATQEVVAAEFWNSISFQNLSVETLAYVYENTLTDDQTRQELGTHSTPSAIARYIAGRLLTEIPASGSIRIVEPCSGHGIFLVAALERLRELLPLDMDPAARHRLFVRSLYGFEKDPFALEVSRLCMMLADFPYPNGWQLMEADVFASEAVEKSLRQSDIVLCNPPFEDFTPAERECYPDRRFVQKPAELLWRVLDRLQPGGKLGFVLPRQFLDGRGYREIRERLGRRFQSIELVALPDRVFQASRHETVLLVAREPAPSPEAVHVSFARVSNADHERFLMDFVPTWIERESKTPDAVARSLRISPLSEVWHRLCHLQTLGDIAELHRGIQWQPPFREEKYRSAKRKPGFREGLYKVTDRLYAFGKPETCYLSFRQEDRLRNAFDLPWELPKAFVNSARISAGPWRLMALADHRELCCSQRFLAVWPNTDWTVEAIAAIVNGPLANAFVATREDKRDNRKATLLRIPVPPFTSSELAALTRLVRTYTQLTAPGEFVIDGDSQGEKARELLLQIDAFVLRAYGLPPRLERPLLDFFRGHQRRVPFPFTEYFPPSFKPHLPLWMYTADEFAKCNSRFFLETIPKIMDPVLVEALSEVE